MSGARRFPLSGARRSLSFLRRLAFDAAALRTDLWLHVLCNRNIPSEDAQHWRFRPTIALRHIQIDRPVTGQTRIGVDEDIHRSLRDAVEQTAKTTRTLTVY